MRLSSENGRFGKYKKAEQTGNPIKNQIFTTLPLLSDGLAHREKQGWSIIPIPLFFIHNRRKILSTNSINA